MIVINRRPYSHKNAGWLGYLFDKMTRGYIIPKAGRCQQCASDVPLHAHHPNYSHVFTVVWLCPRCHFWEHRPNLPSRPVPPRAKVHRTYGENTYATEYKDAQLFDSNADIAEQKEESRSCVLRMLAGTRKLGGTNRSQYF